MTDVPSGMTGSRGKRAVGAAQLRHDAGLSPRDAGVDLGVANRREKRLQLPVRAVARVQDMPHLERCVEGGEGQ